MTSNCVAEGKEVPLKVDLFGWLVKNLLDLRDGENEVQQNDPTSWLIRDGPTFLVHECFILKIPITFWKQLSITQIGLPLNKIILKVEPTKKIPSKTFQANGIVFFLLFFTLGVIQSINYCDIVPLCKKVWCVVSFPPPVHIHRGLCESAHGHPVWGVAEQNFWHCQLLFLNTGWLHTFLCMVLFCAVKQQLQAPSFVCCQWRARWLLTLMLSCLPASWCLHSASDTLEFWKEIKLGAHK